MNSFAVIFDMDGLMLDTERIARSAWLHAMAQHGYHMDETAYLQLLGRTLRDVECILGEHFGPQFPFQSVYAERQRYADEEMHTNGVPVKAGLRELIAGLEQRGIPFGIGSSTHRHYAIWKLTHAGLIGHFQVMVCGDEVANGKPAPDLFLEAARRLNMPPENCVVLEDSDAGVQAAHAAGMLPVMIPDLKQPEAAIAALAYRVVPSLNSVIGLLDELDREGSPQRGITRS